MAKPHEFMLAGLRTALSMCKAAEDVGEVFTKNKEFLKRLREFEPIAYETSLRLFERARQHLSAVKVNQTHTKGDTQMAFVQKPDTGTAWYNERSEQPSSTIPPYDCHIELSEKTIRALASAYKAEGGKAGLKVRIYKNETGKPRLNIYVTGMNLMDDAWYVKRLNKQAQAAPSSLDDEIPF